MDGQPITNVCWNATGKLIAGSMDNMVNIWATAGRDLFSTFVSLNFHANWLQLGVFFLSTLFLYISYYIIIDILLKRVL